MKQKICTKSCDEISIAIPKIVDGKKIKSTSRIQVSVVLFIVIICKFDDLLIKCGLPTDDSVYNPFFDIIGLAILGYHIYGIIRNFKKFNSLSKLENEQYILDQTQSDKQES